MSRAFFVFESDSSQEGAGVRFATTCRISAKDVD
jgi:hypothetical protein